MSQVTESGEVRLTGACVPRHATLPLEKENPVSEFVYLAPEVLRKELYITSADIYGYGLLMYELLCERKAFQEQRKSTFKDFAERVNPEKMLHLLTHISACLTEGTIKLISHCVQISEDDRPNMHVVIEMLDSLKGDFGKEVTGRRPGMHTPGEVFRRPRECEKNTH
jgi:serine/threonine protein kinase